jgi:hypothetical protein
VSTFAQAAANLAQAADRIAGAGSEHALTEAGVAAKTTVAQAAMAELGPDATLSRFGKGRSRGRIRAEARFDPEPGLKLVIAPTKRSAGLWALIQFGSRGSSWRYPKRRGRKRRDGKFTRPPVAARHAWSEATPRVAAAAFAAYHRDLAADVARTIRGG